MANNADSVVKDDEVKEGLCTFEVYDNGRLIMIVIVLHQKISAIGTTLW